MKYHSKRKEIIARQATDLRLKITILQEITNKIALNRGIAALVVDIESDYFKKLVGRKSLPSGKLTLSPYHGVDIIFIREMD